LSAGSRSPGGGIPAGRRRRIVSTGGQTTMRTPARIMDHPIHPMLIPFPIGLWVFSLAADIT